VSSGPGKPWPFSPPVTPMEARLEEKLPEPPGWAYEPKWDGFRAVSWGPNGPSGLEAVRLDSRNHRPLLRYFPELRPALEGLPPGTVVDGEVVLVRDKKLDFDALQNRLHPAESRVRLLSKETPASLVAFDLLGLLGEDVRQRPFRERRELLVELLRTLETPWHLTPSTHDAQQANTWFWQFESAGFDGVVAKNLNHPYAEGRRDMIKIKHRRTVDCVVGGYRVHKEGDRIGSLLLGLYDHSGELNFIGHCSGLTIRESRRLLTLLSEMGEAESFGEHARRPGGESRWSGDKDLAWVPVRPELVVEVSYDQLTGGRFRHATRFERWRPDKDARDCTMDQLERPAGPGFEEIIGGT
jgi:ATP-dependent DNA ligase